MSARHFVAALLVASGLLVVAASLSGGQEPTPTPPAPGGASTGGTEAGGGTTTRGEALPGGAPELANYHDKVVFVVDRSGSMALADRFSTALDIVDQLLNEMSKDLKFDIYLMNESAHSL